jgi:hypothetical protein
MMDFKKSLEDETCVVQLYNFIRSKSKNDHVMLHFYFEVLEYKNRSAIELESSANKIWDKYVASNIFKLHPNFVGQLQMGMTSPGYDTFDELFLGIFNLLRSYFNELRTLNENEATCKLN